jgi:sulfatase modifying factor 1
MTILSVVPHSKSAGVSPCLAVALLFAACTYDRRGLENVSPTPDSIAPGGNDGPVAPRDSDGAAAADARGDVPAVEATALPDAPTERTLAERPVDVPSSADVVDAEVPLDPAPPMDAMVDTDGTGCPDARGGPTLVRVGTFCIDATEVTNSQYAVFWGERRFGQETGGQIPACSWNNSYTPESAGGASWPAAPTRESRPVVNVDWCDAYAFCQWAGKRLCGRIGQGSLTRWQDTTTAAISQWTYACTSGGRLRWPYGNDYDADACNAERPSPSANSLVDVASKPRCRTESGVYDLSGNVEEWTDACDAASGPNDACALVGASAFHKFPDDLSCAGSPYPDKRAATYELRGFRCCAP